MLMWFAVLIKCRACGQRGSPKMSPVKKSTDRHFQNQVHRPRWPECQVHNQGEAPVLHSSRVKIKNLKSGIFSNAHMHIYCGRRLYAETDTLLLPGTQIYIGIEDSPFTSHSNVYDVFRAEVASLRHLNGMPYKYGYDIKLILTP